MTRYLTRGAALLGALAIATSLATIAPTFADTAPAPFPTGVADMTGNTSANTAPAAPVAESTAPAGKPPTFDAPATTNKPMKPVGVGTVGTPPGPPPSTPAGDAVKSWHAANDNTPATGGAAPVGQCS